MFGISRLFAFLNREQPQDHTSELEHRRSLKDRAEKATKQIFDALEESRSTFGSDEEDVPPLLKTWKISDKITLAVSNTANPDDVNDYIYHALCFRDGLDEYMPDWVAGVSIYDEEQLPSLVDRSPAELKMAVDFMFLCSVGMGGTPEEFEYCGITIPVAEGSEPEDVVAAFEKEAAALISMRNFKQGHRAGIQVVTTPEDPTQ